MKKNNYWLTCLLFFMVLSFTSCGAIKTVFETGLVVWGLIIVVVIGVIFWLVSKAKK